MTRVAVAYIRRSVSRAGDEGDVSRDFQTEAVKRMAGADAASLRVIDADWGISAAQDHLEKRKGFLTMLDRIAAGEVSIVYAYSLDRLARDVIASERLLRACRAAGTTIETIEGRFDPDNDGSDMMFSLLAVMNQNTARQMSRKALATAANLRGKHDRGEINPKTGRVYEVAGRKGYGADPRHPQESVDLILEAYRRSRSFLGAAKLLDAAKVPTRFGGPWTGMTVARIVKKHRPEVAKRPLHAVSSRGRKPRATALMFTE